MLECRDSKIRERHWVGWDNKKREKAVVVSCWTCRPFVCSEFSTLFEILILLKSWQTYWWHWRKDSALSSIWGSSWLIVSQSVHKAHSMLVNLPLLLCWESHWAFWAFIVSLPWMHVNICSLAPQCRTHICGPWLWHSKSGLSKEI